MNVKQLKQLFADLEDDWEIGFKLDCDRDGYTAEVVVLCDPTDETQIDEVIGEIDLYTEDT